MPDYISKVIVVTNELKYYGETLFEQVIIEKALRSLTPQFNYIFVAIEHSKDTITIRIKELQSSLEVQELRLTERNFERETEHALKAQTRKASFVKKNYKQACLENKKKNTSGARRSKLSNSDEKKHKNVHEGKYKFDKRKV